ncbi:MAG: TRAP transporter substrate-binding protein [Gammaproteobacteria bacterium AqS3]|nr:TRAP transporter substrate-binding protein [Gammaproteobacteria bacterium AqS3]
MSLNRGLRTAGMMAVLLAVGCADQQAARVDQSIHEWVLVSTLPRSVPGVGAAAERIAERLEAVSGGRLKVSVHAAGEAPPGMDQPLAPPAVFDAVASGRVQVGMGTPSMWAERIPAAALFGAVPFGMDSIQFAAWIHHGGGYALWRELYAGHGLVPFAAGSTGAQMAGWFVRPLRTPDDLQGLKMRTTGLGAEVLRRLGVEVVQTPPGELLEALRSGELDAAEWKGPYNDAALGLERSGAQYYYPGWQEPDGTLELIVNAEALAALPEDLREVFSVSAMALQFRIRNEYRHENMRALEQMRSAGIEPVRIPDAVLEALARVSRQVLSDAAAEDADFARIYSAYRQSLLHQLETAAIGEDAIFGLQGLDDD